VGVNTGSPAAPLHVAGVNGTSIRMNTALADAGGNNFMDFYNSVGRMGYLGYASGSADIFYVWNEQPSTLVAGTNSVEHMRFHPTDGTVFNETSVDQNFRVESNSNENMLFVDGGTNRVGVGTGSPTEDLEVSGVNPTVKVTATTNNWAAFDNQAGDTQANYMFFRDAAAERARITVSNAENFIVSTGATPVSRMQIDPVATVFNESGANLDFRVESDSNTHALFVDAGNNRVAVGTAGTNYTGSGFAVQGRTTLNNGATTIGQNLIVDGYVASSDDNILVIGTQRSSGGPFIGYGLGQNGTDSFWSATYDNFSGAHSVLVLNGSTLEFLTDASNSQTAVGAEVTAYQRMALGRTEASFNGANSNTDFRVASDTNTHALFVDAGANKVVFGSNGYPNVNVSSPRVYDAVFNNGLSIGDATFTHGFIGTGGTDGNVEIVANSYPANLGSSRQVIISSGTAGGGGPAELARFDSEDGAVFNETSLNRDFRVESDTNSHALFVDASENRVFAGGLSSGSVGSAQFIVNAGEIGTSVGDTLRLQQWYYGTGNGSFFGHKARRTSANGVWTGVVVDTVLEVDNSPDLYNYITYGIGSLVFNDSGNDMDFRVESAVNGTQFVIDGQYGFISIGKSTSAAGTNGLHFGSAGTSAIISASGTGNTWHTYSTSTNSYNFIVGANGTVSYVSLNQLSDEREKENIVDIPVGLEAVKQLRPCQFDWKAAEQGTNVYGFIAQEVESVIPTIVSEYKKSDTETRKSIKHVDLIAVLTKAMQEQQAMIETLEARITALENA